MTLLMALALTAAERPSRAADDPLKLGVLATLEGPFEPFGADALRGFELALEEFENEAGGRAIEPLIEKTDGSAERVVEQARHLVNRGARILIGPLGGTESLAIREFAKRVPEVTFVNGASAAQDATLRMPAENFFRFNADSVQWIAGLGTFAYERKGYGSVIAVAEDYSFPYSQLMGFMVEYCARGGRVVAKHWVSHGERAFDGLAERVAAVKADALFVALDPDTAASFLGAYWQAGGRAQVIAGSTTLSETLLSANGAIRPLVRGAVSAMPVAEESRSELWTRFVERYRARYPEAPAMPSIFAITYYINTKAVMLALEETDGELGDDHAVLRDALAELEFDTPIGTVSLDAQRQAIADAFVVEVAEADDGTLYNRVVDVVHGVDQTLGLSRDEFLALGPPGRDNPSCP